MAREIQITYADFKNCLEVFENVNSLSSDNKRYCSEVSKKMAKFFQDIVTERKQSEIKDNIILSSNEEFPFTFEDSERIAVWNATINVAKNPEKNLNLYQKCESLAKKFGFKRDFYKFTGALKPPEKPKEMKWDEEYEILENSDKELEEGEGKVSGDSGPES